MTLRLQPFVRFNRRLQRKHQAVPFWVVQRMVHIRVANCCNPPFWCPEAFDTGVQVVRQSGKASGSQLADQSFMVGEVAVGSHGTHAELFGNSSHGYATESFLRKELFGG